MLLRSERFNVEKQAVLLNLKRCMKTLAHTIEAKNRKGKTQA